jgi:hypothetical protein
MTREVRRALLIVAAVAVAAVVLGGLLRIEFPVLVPFPVLGMMAWGMLDAAAHRDSVWRAADQNKVVWVFVQLIPVLGTMAYYILVHRTLLDAEDRATNR